MPDGHEMGFTTGTGAAAAAKLAVRTWLTQKLADSVDIKTPSGMVFTIPAHRCVLKSTFAAAAIKKNSGADPDVTRGVEIYAIARPAKVTTIRGGAGVGLVTKPGLAVAVGERAINPVPRSMIIRSVEDEVSDINTVSASTSDSKAGSTDTSEKADSVGKVELATKEEAVGKVEGEKVTGFEITIFIPKGKELAKRTMNARLGIIGGISVLGTTGVVRPMSHKVYQESLIAQIAIARAIGLSSVVLVFGNIGKRFAIGKLGVNDDAVIEVSNWPILLAQECLKAGVERIVLAGHISKVLKVAAGLEDTSHESKFATDVFLDYATTKLGGSSELFLSIKDVNTTEEAAAVLQGSEAGKNLIEQIGNDAKKFLSARTGYLEECIGVMITDLAGEVLAEDQAAKIIIDSMPDSRSALI